MRDTRLEINGHGLSTGELTEDHLLPSLSGDGLKEELSGWSGIEVRKETVYTRFSPSVITIHQPNESRGPKQLRCLPGQSLTEVNKVSNGFEIVLVSTLQSTGSVVPSDNVMKESGVSDLLVC